MRAELAEAQRRLDPPQEGHHVQVLYPAPSGKQIHQAQSDAHPSHVPLVQMCVCVEKNSLGFRVVFGPDPLELIQVMWPEDGPITCQIVKVIHDDGDKQVDDLERRGAT